MHVSMHLCMHTPQHREALAHAVSLAPPSSLSGLAALPLPGPGPHQCDGSSISTLRAGPSNRDGVRLSGETSHPDGLRRGGGVSAPKGEKSGRAISFREPRAGAQPGEQPEGPVQGLVQRVCPGWRGKEGQQLGAQGCWEASGPMLPTGFLPLKASPLTSGAWGWEVGASERSECPQGAVAVWQAPGVVQVLWASPTA